MPVLRSGSQIPLRPAEPTQTDAGTRIGRIPLSSPRPAPPDPRFRPSAFSGEAVPFGVTAFREGHDIIGVHVRLTSPSGAESLHRLSPLGDGFDRWRTVVAPIVNAFAIAHVDELMQGAGIALSRAQLTELTRASD